MRLIAGRAEIEQNARPTCRFRPNGDRHGGLWVARGVRSDFVAKIRIVRQCATWSPKIGKPVDI
jgi:hypothetical protein